MLKKRGMIDNNLLYLLAGCFGLGMLHGVIPDEHTWPITFSYSVGTTTGKSGMMAGSFFSLAFTTQRAIMSQIVYFAVGAFLVSSDLLNGPVYSIVGLVMAIAGYLILKNKMPHIHLFMKISRKDLAKHIPMDKQDKKSKLLVPVHWCFIHGFISGFGVDTGIFSVWIYLVTLPAMASSGLWMLGWLPGALFGIGTFVILVLIGFVFGEVLQVSKRFGAQRIEKFGRLVGARVLLFGGILFILLGPLYYFGVDKLLPFDFGTFIVLLVMIAIAIPTMAFTWHPLGNPYENLIVQDQLK